MASTAEQIRAARESVLVVDEPDLGVVVVTGADRATWLNGLVTCDVSKMTEDAAMYGLVVTQKGRIMTDLFVVMRPDRLLLVVPKTIRADLATMLERYVIMEDAELAIDESLHVAFAHGPKAAELGGVRCDRTGLGGALLFDDVTGRVHELGGVVGDMAGWELLRLETGVPRFRVDFDDKTYPQEASLEKRAVSFDKGCYLGQEVVCMLELRGHVKRKLVPIVLEGNATAGASVLDAAGTEVGKLSSVGISPTLSRQVGLAMVKLASAAPGTKLRIAGASAEVVERPVP